MGGGTGGSFPLKSLIIINLIKSMLEIKYCRCMFNKVKFTRLVVVLVSVFSSHTTESISSSDKVGGPSEQSLRV